MAPLVLWLISWKSVPQSIKIFVKLDFSLMFWLFGLFLSTLQHYWEHQLTALEKKCHFGFDSGKIVNFKFIGEDFFINLKNNGAIVVPWFSTIRG